MSVGNATTTDLDTFHEEVDRFVDATAPKSLYGTRKGRFDGFWGGRRHPPVDPDVRRWCDAMAERGWTAPTWPIEYGGGGLNHDQAEILNAALEARQLPAPLVGFGVTMIGPTLLDFGTHEQKLEHLPRICRGEVRWCQGYSEPGAGSDLAGLRTKAVRDGDRFILNGQKTWTSFAHLSDWIFCLVRTDFDAPKHDGISFILVDMLQDGVQARPIELISGSSPFCEVFLDNAVADARNVVGQVNGGWTVAKALLGYERSMVGTSIGGQLNAAEGELLRDARRHIGPDHGPLADPELRARLAAYGIDTLAFDLTIRRIGQSLAAGHKPGSESSILKLVGSELKQARWELAQAIAGLDGLGWEGDGFDPRDLEHTREWLRSRANTIEGGTSEIQLNILAKRVLGLPD